jgi:hypothetical protein
MSYGQSVENDAGEVNATNLVHQPYASVWRQVTSVDAQTRHESRVLVYNHSVSGNEEGRGSKAYSSVESIISCELSMRPRSASKASAADDLYALNRI